jgi:subtilisin-like proprotein convertase family protein
MNLTSRLTTGAAATLVLTAAALTTTSDARAATTTSSSTQGSLIGSHREYQVGAPGIDILDAPLTGGVGTATPYASDIPVDGLLGTVSEVTVGFVDFQHAYPRDVDVLLVSPSGTAVTLMSDVGGATPTGKTYLTFDDDAAAEVPNASTVTEGTYRPTDLDGGVEDEFPAPAPTSAAPATLAAFDGEDPNGVWRLFVVDDTHTDVGSIARWSITVETSGGQEYPSPVTLSGLTSPVTDVDVRLDGLSHARSDDLDALLVGPHGQKVFLLSDVGAGAGTTDSHVVLDDEAAVAAGSPLLSGTFRPTDLDSVADEDVVDATPVLPAPAGSLSVFDGIDANGTWRLYLTDDQDGKRGSLASWTLVVTTEDGPVVVTPTPQTPGDTTAPRVTGVRPAARAHGVRRGATVSARLSERVALASVTRRSAYLVAKGSTRHVRATVAVRQGTVVIDPKGLLREHTTYRVVLTPDIRDLAGNALTRTGWRFTTR